MILAEKRQTKQKPELGAKSTHFGQFLRSHWDDPPFPPAETGVIGKIGIFYDPTGESDVEDVESEQQPSRSSPPWASTAAQRSGGQPKLARFPFQTIRVAMRIPFTRQLAFNLALTFFLVFGTLPLTAANHLPAPGSCKPSPTNANPGSANEQPAPHSGISATVTPAQSVPTPNPNPTATTSTSVAVKPPKASSVKSKKPNLLFIMIDDLRPQLGCFGKSFMHSPHIDALANRGQLFERAYCMVPTCGASRASLMSGLRPHPGRFISYTARADEDAPGFTTMNQHLKNHGYRTISLGKVFHFPDDSAAGWSEKSWRPNTHNYRDRKAEQQAIAAHKKKYPKRTKVRGMPYEAFDADDSEYRDHQIATRAIKHLVELQQNNSPFFLAVGFFKPHLPFCAPQQYWDLYDFESIQVPDNFRSPPKAPRGAVHQSAELRSYATIPPKGSVSTEQARKLIHGYYACVSFIDAQVGRLTKALQDTGLANNTVVILCGDHGWQLGDHGMWNKHSCFETSMQTPLIVSIPEQQLDTAQGGRIAALTELIDIYPTVCELTGIPKPEHLQGTSFVPLLKNPKLSGKPQAVGRYRDGDTIRTDRFRLSEYRKRQGTQLTLGSMLYDHRTDPDENINLADREQQQNTVKTLSEMLHNTIPKSLTTTKD